MPNPSEVYESLIAEISDEDELAAFNFLLNATAERVTREELIDAVFPDGEPTGASLQNNTKDRKVRAIIANLRERGYPIVSSSDQPGYSMKADESEMDKFIAQQGSRIEKLKEKINKAHQSRKFMKMVQEYRVAKVKPVQGSFL